MASSELEKAKTLLTLALIRPDPNRCQPKEIETIVALLQTATNKCSPENVQNCKKWALDNLVSSERRAEPFCNYLVALANSFQPIRNKGSRKPLASEEARVPSAARRRLHILYILNDVIYHVKFRLPPPGPGQKSFINKLEPTLPLLVKSAATFPRQPKQIEKLRGLVSVWSEKGYFSASFLGSLRKAIDEGLTKGATGQDDTGTQDNASSANSGPKPVPFNLPRRHGDPSTAWYDLPPGNWLPWIDGTYPLDPHKISPMEFKPGPAREDLVNAVTKVLADVKQIFTKEVQLDAPQFEISEMGERLERSNKGEITGGDTYYGWSRKFCKKMKDKERDHVSRGRAPERSQSLSASISRSTSQSHGRYQHRDRSNTSSSRPRFNRHRSGSNASSRSGHSTRQRSRSPAYSRSSSRGSDYRVRDYQASGNRGRGGYGTGYNSQRGGYRQQSREYDQSRPRAPFTSTQAAPNPFTPTQAAPNNSVFPAHQRGTNMLSGENIPPYFQNHPHNQNMQTFPMPHMFPQGPSPAFPHQGYGNFQGHHPPPQSTDFQGQYPPPPPHFTPGKPGWGRGGFNGMGRGRGGYQRGGRW